MISAVGHIDAAGLVDGDRSGFEYAFSARVCAETVEMEAFRAENLQSIVSRVADEHSARTVACDAVGVEEFTVEYAGASKAAQPFAFVVEDEHTSSAFAENIAMARDSADSCTARRQTPEMKSAPVSERPPRELHDALFALHKCQDLAAIFHARGNNYDVLGLYYCHVCKAQAW